MVTMRKRDIIIDLTALLDVILILFFAILIQTRGAARSEIDAAREAVSEAEAQRDEARAEADLLSRMLHTEELLLDNNLVITLSVAEDESLLMEADGQTAAQIAYEWDKNGYPFEQVRNRLRTMTNRFRNAEKQAGTEGDFGVFVVFQYDSESIRKGQYDSVQKAVQGWKAEGGNGVVLNYFEMDATPKR